MTLDTPDSVKSLAQQLVFWSHHQQHAHPTLQAAHGNRTYGERVADRIASFCVSWPFIFIFLGIAIIWMVTNPVPIQRVWKEELTRF